MVIELEPENSRIIEPKFVYIEQNNVFEAEKNPKLLVEDFPEVLTDRKGYYQKLTAIAPQLNKTIYGKVIRSKHKFYSNYEYFEGNEMFGFGSCLRADKMFFGYKIYKTFEESKKCVGVIKSNFMGTEYLLTEKGRQTIFVKYKTHLLAKKEPRKFDLFYVGYKDENLKPLLQRIKEMRWDEMVFMTNKYPIYNLETGFYVLNFNGRVKKPSVKNFQIVHPKQIHDPILTFGKTDENQFVLDYSFPFTAIQAFFLAVIACDFKLGCE